MYSKLKAVYLLWCMMMMMMMMMRRRRSNKPSH